MQKSHHRVTLTLLSEPTALALTPRRIYDFHRRERGLDLPHASFGAVCDSLVEGWESIKIGTDIRGGDFGGDIEVRGQDCSYDVGLFFGGESAFQPNLVDEGVVQADPDADDDGITGLGDGDMRSVGRSRWSR